MPDGCFGIIGAIVGVIGLALLVAYPGVVLGLAGVGLLVFIIFKIVSGQTEQTDTFTDVIRQTKQTGTFTDPRDGKTYKTVTIGNQTWMAENLNYEAEGSKCYNNDPANGQKYGRLYKQETAKKACPPGWHLPSWDEWQELVNFAGGEIAGKKLKATNGWIGNGNGTDEYGFAALPGGSGSYDDRFSFVGMYGYWWTAKKDSPIKAYFRFMDDHYESVGWDNDLDSKLRSVRCIKDYSFSASQL